MQSSRAIVNVCLGQALSLLATAANAVNQQLNGWYGINVAALQMCAVYGMLAVGFWTAITCFFPAQVKVRNLWAILPLMVLISFLDTTASIMCLRAYACVNSPTVALLSTVSTPTVLLLSSVTFRRTYAWNEILGSVMAVSGVAILSVYQLVLAKEGSLSILGYGACILSAMMYGLSNVLTEKLTTDGTSVAQYLALNSSFATIWSAIYLFTLGRGDLWQLAYKTTSGARLLLAFYCLSMGAFYSLMPLLMARGSASLFNISLLTVNLYTLIVNVLLFDDSFSWQFFLSFSIVMAGLILYNLPLVPKVEKRLPTAFDSHPIIR